MTFKYTETNVLRDERKRLDLKGNTISSQLQDEYEEGIKSGMSKRCHLLTTSAPVILHPQRKTTPQSTPRSSPPTCSPPKNISIVITRRPLPFLHPIPPPLHFLFLPPTVPTTDWRAPTGACPTGFPVQTHSALSSLPACAPNQAVVSPMERRPQRDQGTGERAEQCVLPKVPTRCDPAEGVHVKS